MFPTELDPFFDRIFAPLGRFVVSFEYLAGGFATREQAKAATSRLTATPLLELFETTLYSVVAANDSHKIALSELSGATRDLIRARNELIHGLWVFFDLADLEYGAPQAFVSKKGKATLTPSVYDRERLLALSQRAVELREQLRRFLQCIREHS